MYFFFFFQAEDGIRDYKVTGVQTCALPICLVHVSEMSWTRRVRHPSKLVNVGDTVEVMVLEVNKATKRISLGMKQVETDPWATITERYQPGMRVQGKVRNLTDFGAFVEL